MKYSILILYILMGSLLSCKDQKQTIQTRSETGIFDDYSINQKSLNTTKTIQKYLKRLKESKYQYTHTIDSSYFYNNTTNGLIYNRSIKEAAIENFRKKLKKVDRTIEEQASFFLQSNLLVINRYESRARLHAYSFVNDSIAIANFNYLTQLKKELPHQWQKCMAWNLPDTILRKENRIYHIVTGSKNLPDLPKEIAGIIFDYK